MRKIHFAALILSTAVTAASAQAVRTERNMSLDLANQIAAATVATCTANGYAVTATVVDRAGSVRAVQRADNAGPHTLGASQAKGIYLRLGQKHHAGDDGRGAEKPCGRQSGLHPGLPAGGAACAGQSWQRSHWRGGCGWGTRRPSGRAVRRCRTRQSQGTFEVNQAIAHYLQHKYAIFSVAHIAVTP
jgi:hypothetical protein